MPELPEVETVCRGLRPVLEGRSLVHVEARRPDLRVPLPADFADRLTGQSVVRVARRSKYALIECANGLVMILHLGMSGRITMTRLDEGVVEPGRHDHLVFDTDDGIRLVFSDPRRFGLAAFADRDRLDQHPLLRHIGPEPLGNTFSAAYLDEQLAGRRTSIKAALMDQRLVAGLGNIYVCEALNRAGISPRRMAATIPGARAARLAPAVREVLEDAIAAGGSTLKDYARVDGELGYFQTTFRVYGREGEACVTPGCGGTIGRIVQSGRSTFFCSHCQR